MKKALFGKTDFYSNRIGPAVSDIGRKLVLADTFFRWQKNYDAMVPHQAGKLKQLRAENERLKNSRLT
ncbi:MAG: hypothetical protein ACI95C_000641 [Pseudohongiellaceae bacterium]|jgi:hypothetical protein